jgi:hypothetical protein
VARTTTRRLAAWAISEEPDRSWPAHGGAEVRAAERGEPVGVARGRADQHVAADGAREMDAWRFRGLPEPVALCQVEG